MVMSQRGGAEVGGAEGAWSGEVGPGATPGSSGEGWGHGRGVREMDTARTAWGQHGGDTVG